ncbi:hypothetical protein JXM83_06855 [Candidatus Woesearchaeota archaeon]|nr:hypothetical protein [Candidatus Woesearchaeota archaeon]
MGNLEQSLLETLENEAKKLSDDPKVKEFAKADKDFTELVNKGLASRRGYNLMSVDNIHLRRFSFNSSH